MPGIGINMPPQRMNLDGFMKIAILGTGNVGKALWKGLSKKHEVKFGSRNPIPSKVNCAEVLHLSDAAKWADVVIAAVPYRAMRDVVEKAGNENLKGKVVIDVSNTLDESGAQAVVFSSSAAEELSKMLPGAKVVKAFNTVFAENMGSGSVGAHKLTLFIAGDDKSAKGIVEGIGKDIGFEPVDVGPLMTARYIEPMGLALISMGFMQRMGTRIGISLVKD